MRGGRGLRRVGGILLPRWRTARLFGGAAWDTQGQLATVRVQGHAVVIQERVAEDAVNAGTRLVQDNRHVAQRGSADLERFDDGRWTARPAAKRLQLDRLTSDERLQAGRRREGRPNDDDAGPRVEQESAPVAVDGDWHDPDAQA